MEWVAILTVFVVISCLVATRVFGHVEFLLLNRRLLGIGHYLAPFGSRGHKASYQLQGNYEWELMWNGLVEATDRFGRKYIGVAGPIPDEIQAWEREDAIASGG